MILHISRKNTKNSTKNKILFGFFTTSSYLCTRFPRNRWQEDRRVACYVAPERYNNRLIFKEK